MVVDVFRMGGAFALVGGDEGVEFALGDGGHGEGLGEVVRRLCKEVDWMR